MNEQHDCFPGVEVGTTITFARTVSESDVYLFAGISGDHSPNHTDEEYMRGTRFGHRIAHGALTLGLMSTCSTRLIEQMGNIATVNYGYDKVRFTGPVYFGDTVKVNYIVAELDRTSGRLRADVKATNQKGDLVAVATNLLRAVNE